MLVKIMFHRFRIILLIAAMGLLLYATPVVVSLRPPQQYSANDVLQYSIQNTERINDLQRRVIYLESQEAGRVNAVQDQRFDNVERQIQQIYDVVRWLLAQAAVYFVQLITTGAMWFNKQQRARRDG